MTKFVVMALVLYGCLTVAIAQEFPLWKRLLSHYGGKNDDPPVPSMKMGSHMQMSLKDAPQPGDVQRASQIVLEARAVLTHYADVNLALHDGYRPFQPTGRMAEEVHYTNYRIARREQRSIDYRDPDPSSTGARPMACGRSV